MSTERDGQLDPQSLVAQSVGVLIGSPAFIAGGVTFNVLHKGSRNSGDAAFFDKKGVSPTLARSSIHILVIPLYSLR